MIKKFLVKRKEKKRQQILALIGRDIDDIAYHAYNDGCYVTTKQMQAQKTIEFAQLVAENEKLREMMIEHANLVIPTIKVQAE